MNRQHEREVSILQAKKIALDLALEESRTPINRQAVSLPINNKRCEEERTLHSASKNGRLNVVKKLVKRCGNVDKPDNCERTPLHYAAENGHLNIVQYLIKQKANVNEQSINFMIPLHLAALNGHSDVVEYLVSHKGEVNARDES